MKMASSKNKRTEELVKMLNAECGKHGNDCGKCSLQKECKEYCKLSGIDKIVNSDFPL